MVLNKPESSDSIAKNSLVVPAGSYALLKIALREGATGPLVPLDADWASVGSSLVVIQDPDLATLAYGTNDLDAGDPDDDFDENRASYVGDQVTPEVVGLHATLSGGLPVRLALKIFVPSGAEQTSSSSGRAYKVTWGLKKGGNVVVATETFNVGPSGVPVFGDIIITWDEVIVGITSSITDVDQQADIILEAAEHIKAHLEMCDICPDGELPAKNRAIKQAMILYARSLVFDYDASAGVKHKSIKEGSKSVSFAGVEANSGSSGDGFRLRAMLMIDEYCKRFGSKKRVRMRVVDHHDYKGRDLR